MTIAEKIKAARKQAGLLSKVAADKAGMSPQAWSNLESGRYNTPSVSTLRRVADALGYELSIEFRRPHSRKK